MISVGIDISKGKSMVCILKPYGEVVLSPYEIEHTRAALDGLSEYILSLEGEVRVILEATGAYHLPLVECIQNAGIFVSVIQSTGDETLLGEHIT